MAMTKYAALMFSLHTTPSMTCMVHTPLSTRWECPLLPYLNLLHGEPMKPGDYLRSLPGLDTASHVFKKRSS